MTVNLDTEIRVKESTSTSSAEAAAGVSQTTENIDIDYSQSAAQVNGKGVTVESSQANVVSRTELTIIDINTILDKVKEAGIDLTDEDVASVKQKIADAGIAIDNKGNITLESDENTTKLANILNQFLIINKQKTIEFTEDSDQEFINKLVEDNIIKLNDDQKTYTILDADKLSEALPDQTNEVLQQSIDLIIEGSKKTVTVTEENKVNVPENIKTCKRSEKKQFNKDMNQGVANWANEPENASVVEFAVANAYYGKDISKKREELIKENDLKRYEDVVQYYLKNYATTEESALVQYIFDKELSNMNDEDLLNFYKEARPEDKNPTFEGPEGAAKKEIAQYLYAASKIDGWSQDALLNRMSLVEVLNEKKANGKFEKDKEKWIKDQAKDQVRTAETIQNIQNTTTYFSKEDAKNARKSETDKTKIHQDIGKAGRKLVMACPDTFCERVTEDQADFSVKIDGEDVYFKFSQEKWDTWCSEQVNTMDKDGYGKDEHGTLNELRDTWMNDLTLITADGKSRTLEEILGNENGKVGNGELNKLRNMIETSGRSVDANPTAWKRLGYVLKNAAVAYGLGFLTAGVGSLAAGAVNVGVTATATASATATATASATATAGGYTYTAYTDPQTHEVTVNYIDKGVLVDQTTYTITDDPQLVSIDVPEQTVTETATETVTAESTSTASANVSKKPNRLKIADNAGATAVLLSVPHSLATMSKVNAKGTADGQDAVIADLTIRRTEESEEESTNLNLNLQATRTVCVKSGTMEVKNDEEYVRKIPIKCQGPDAYMVLYDGIDNAKTRKAVRQALVKEWGVTLPDMPSRLWFPESIKVTVDGKEITVNLKKNWEKIYEEDIPVGQGGGQGRIVNIMPPKKQKSASISAKGTVY